MPETLANITDNRWLSLSIALSGAVIIALIASLLVSFVVSRAGRRSVVAKDLNARGKVPFRIALVLLCIRVALDSATPNGHWQGLTGHILELAFIAAVAWLVGALAFVVEDLLLSRYNVNVVDNRRARRARTQIMVLRRLTVALLVVIAIAAMLMTFPSARAFGTSLLASAGVLSVVAGLAAQTSLANVFAGIQLAFTDAIRVDDVVVVEEEWGRIEEITLTYVVVHIWDDRRLILPSTYFTTTPFANWTRSSSQLLGVVEMDVDWRVDVDGMRKELTATVEKSDLWDKRVAILQVTDAIGSFVRVRALVSAIDGPTMFDLRCLVREQLVTWLQSGKSAGLPRLRTEQVETEKPLRRTASVGAADGLFTGSAEAEERSRSFTGDADADSLNQ